ncbi:hypothetical protein INT44_003977 [Umbelopsis vinacea]|uniref:Uncharacterized protein n=1 Tax=Umbelopsis vinacea TaxID=44442 RepID=A0A8H7QA51_9FUNG|nr:hypothetical protein INT44_003977 [Umbelopsis vinacea]
MVSLADGESSKAADEELFSEDIYRHAMIDFVQDERVKAHLDVPELHADIRIDWTAINNTLPVKAALVAVVRNADLYTIRSTIRTIEDRWNHQYNYPWVFLSDQPLSQEFKHYTQMLSGAPMYYGLIDQREWSYPHWIDTRFAEMEMGRYAEMGLFRGGSLDFRLKSRFHTGFIQYHSLLRDLEFYWRVEPESKYLCDINFDPFLFMKENNKKFAFVINDGERMENIPSLWEATRNFIMSHWSFVVPWEKSIQPLVTNKGWQYFNGCLFWNNFAIYSLDYLRSPSYRTFFEYLDKKGGFFYERWSDVTVQTIMASLFLKREELHFFNEIGFEYWQATHCPIQPEYRQQCVCSPEQTTDTHSCTRFFLSLTNSSVAQDVKGLYQRRKQREKEEQDLKRLHEKETKGGSH